MKDFLAWTSFSPAIAAVCSKIYSEKDWGEIWNKVKSLRWRLDRCGLREGRKKVGFRGSKGARYLAKFGAREICVCSARFGRWPGNRWGSSKPSDLNFSQFDYEKLPLMRRNRRMYMLRRFWISLKTNWSRKFLRRFRRLCSASRLCFSFFSRSVKTKVNIISRAVLGITLL